MSRQTVVPMPPDAGASRTEASKTGVTIPLGRSGRMSPVLVTFLGKLRRIFCRGTTFLLVHSSSPLSSPSLWEGFPRLHAIARKTCVKSAFAQPGAAILAAGERAGFDGDGRADVAMQSPIYLVTSDDLTYLSGKRQIPPMSAAKWKIESISPSH